MSPSLTNDTLTSLCVFINFFLNKLLKDLLQLFNSGTVTKGTFKLGTFWEGKICAKSAFWGKNCLEHFPKNKQWKMNVSLVSYYFLGCFYALALETKNCQQFLLHFDIRDLEQRWLRGRQLEIRSALFCVCVHLTTPRSVQTCYVRPVCLA